MQSCGQQKHCFLHVGKEQQKISHQQYTEVPLWQTYRRPGLTWSDLWRNRTVKQKLKTVV